MNYCWTIRTIHCAMNVYKEVKTCIYNEWRKNIYENGEYTSRKMRPNITAAFNPDEHFKGPSYDNGQCQDRALNQVRSTFSHYMRPPLPLGNHKPEAAEGSRWLHRRKAGQWEGLCWREENKMQRHVIKRCNCTLIRSVYNDNSNYLQDITDSGLFNIGFTYWFDFAFLSS